MYKMLLIALTMSDSTIVGSYLNNPLSRSFHIMLQLPRDIDFAYSRDTFIFSCIHIYI